MQPKIKIAISVIILAIALPSFAQDRSPLIGAWRMIKFEAAKADGTLQTVPYSGQLVVTDAGTLSAQAMNPDPNAPPTPYTLHGYEALYGSVIIDDKTHTFVTTVQSALVRNLIGQKTTRAFKVSGDELLLSPVDPSEGWRVTYTRY